MVDDRISKIEERLEKRSEARDKELDELRSGFVEVAAKLRETVAGDAALARRIDALERVPVPQPPSILSIWGPALATAALLAGGVTFILEQRDRPINEAISTLKTEVNKMGSKLEAMRERTLTMYREQGEQNARDIAMQRQLDAIDTRGSRAFNESK